MSDKHSGIESKFDQDGISLVELVAMGCPGNLLDLVCALASQPDTPIPALTDAMTALLFSFQFPEEILVDIIDDFEAVENWKSGHLELEFKFHGSRKFYLYFQLRQIEMALAISRARTAAGIDGWKHHYFADEYSEPCRAPDDALDDLEAASIEICHDFADVPLSDNRRKCVHKIIARLKQRSSKAEGE